MKEFVFRIPTRVIFGCGAVAKTGDEVIKLGARKAFIVTGTGSTVNSAGFARMIESLKSAGVETELYAAVKQDPSITTVDEGALLCRKCGADIVIAYGGGSPMDAGKSIAMLAVNEGSIEDYMRVRRVYDRQGLPFIAIPTTGGTGSELTAGAVTTDTKAQEKIGVTNEFQWAKLAIIDPETHVSMPPKTTSATGLDALTHAIEAYNTSKNHEPFSDALCLHAIRLIGENIRRAYGNGLDMEARSNMALASAMAGSAFAQAGLGSVHGLAHPIGVRFHVPHGVANALMLPYVMEASVVADLPRFRDIAIALGEDVQSWHVRDAAYAAVDAVITLKEDLEIPTYLYEVGVKEEDIAPIIADAMAYRLRPASPRDFNEEDFTKIMARAMGKH